MRTKEILKLLRDARNAATFKRAGFKLEPNVFTDDEDTRKICEATQLYRDTWIVGPLDEVIAEIEKESERRRRTT